MEVSARGRCVSLYHIDDKEYSMFVVALGQRLFGVKPSVYHNDKDSVNDIVISRTELVKFLTEKVGLKLGNKVKQKIDIPDWIKMNKKFLSACIRGLVDTDGSVFTHRYKVKGKMYQYKKLCFTSLSKPLASSVHKSLNDFGIKARFAAGKEVRIDSSSDMEKYFRLIGSHNAKHLRRYTT